MVPAFIALPSKVQALGVDEANSEATKTTTILSGWAVPIETPEYVATLEEALTPAGLAVCVIDTAIKPHYIHHLLVYQLVIIKLIKKY